MAVLVGLVIVAVAVAVATGRGGRLAAVPVDRLLIGLPDGPVTGDDVAALRFSVVVRGYRMDEVDETLDRLETELRTRDDRIAALEAGESMPPTAQGAEAEEPDPPDPDPVAEPDPESPSEEPAHRPS